MLSRSASYLIVALAIATLAYAFLPGLAPTEAQPVAPVVDASGLSELQPATLVESYGGEIC